MKKILVLLLVLPLLSVLVTHRHHELEKELMVMEFNVDLNEELIEIEKDRIKEIKDFDAFVTEKVDEYNETHKEKIKWVWNQWC